SWLPNAPVGSYAITYEIYRNTQPVFETSPPLEPIATVATTSFEDPGPLTVGQAYYYALRAVHSLGVTRVTTSALSTVVAGAIKDSATTPDLLLVAKGKDGAVTVYWQPGPGAALPSPAPSEYRLYRKPNADPSCSSYVNAGSFPYAVSGQFTDSGVPNNVAYDYAITAVVNGTESGFSRQAVGIPLARPRYVSQCAMAEPWFQSMRSTAFLQWSPPLAEFYQPRVPGAAAGVPGYLKGYHLYHYKHISKQTWEKTDDSPTREVVVDASDPVDPYFIERFPVKFPYQDPRYFVNDDTVFSPPFTAPAPDRGVWLDSHWNERTNCVVPKAVYKVFAEGTWLTAESDWPDYFDPLDPVDTSRCKENTLPPL
ncbi:MAG: hypothetical protein ACREA0_29450, partial [bacterium]